MSDRNSDTSRPGQPFSVLLPTYRGDDPGYLDKAIQSVIDQTVEPTELLVVEDGPLTTSLRKVVDDWTAERPDILTTVSLERNRGLGVALRTGIEHCSYDLVARMDADDLSVKNRFETQLRYLSTHPDVDALGGYVVEFGGGKSRVRTVPTTPDVVRQRAKFRSPINHPTVMFRREAVLSAGNYRDLRSMQDYDLWVRMLLDGSSLANVPEVLVRMRVEDGLYGRRGGLNYARLEASLLNEFRQWGFLRPTEFLLCLAVRLPIRLAPSWLRRFVYRTALRGS